MFAPFTAVPEYLFMLREAARALRPAGKAGMIYLAAAVSDFYVPEAEMVREVPRCVAPVLCGWQLTQPVACR